MFTGLVQAVGRLESRQPHSGDERLAVTCAALDFAKLAIGDSIAVAGACLTVVVLGSDRFSVDVSVESLGATTIGGWAPGQRLNLETALCLGQPLGGHLVSGHVDGVGRVIERVDDARSVRMTVELPRNLARYVAKKGSICVDGVSLTINAVSDSRFKVNLVPHTLAVTTLEDLRAGDRVNLEVDLLARYLERLMSSAGESGKEGEVSLNFLREHGYA